MRGYKLSFGILRVFYILVVIIVSYILLYKSGYLIQFFNNSSAINGSSIVLFTVIESLIIYSLVLSIRSTSKSLGLGIVVSSLVLPVLFPSVLQQVIHHPVSLIFYIPFLFVSLVATIGFAILGNGIKSQIIAVIVHLLGIGVLLQYSLLGMSSVSQIFTYAKYLYSYALTTFDGLPLYSIIIGAIGFILLASKKVDFVVFNSIRNVGIPYVLVSFLPAGFYLMYFFSSSISLANYFVFNFPGYVALLMDVVAIILAILLSNKRDLLASIVLSVASLGVALVYTFVFSFPLYSFEFLISGASIIPTKLANPAEIENKLFDLLKEGKTSKANEYLKVLNRLGYSTSRIYCDALNRRACEAIIWLPSKGRIDYLICPQLRYAADCIISKGTIPNDVISLLKALTQRDINSAERLAGLILTKSQDEGTRERAKEVLANIMGVTQSAQEKRISLPSLEEWSPEVWVNNEIYGYKIMSVLGKGGTSYVVLGERGSGKYAIKIPRLTATKDTKESFTTFVDISKESSKLQEISEKSPNIVKLYGVFIDINTIKSITIDKNIQLYYANPPAIIMEYMAGGTAEDLLKNDALFLSNSWKKIVGIVSLQIAKAIKIIHSEGYVHLDIKPSNIFFSTPPGKYAGEVLNNLTNYQVLPKLGDLGSARKIGERFMEYTPQYCGIDQVNAMLFGKGAATSMDIYAFGATIYKLLTKQPYNPPSLISYMDKAVEIYLSKNGNFSMYLSSAQNEYAKYYQSLNSNDEFMKLIKSMTNPDPLKRPSIDQVITELTNILSKLR